MAKELDASLLSIWKELCIVFNQMSMIEPRPQDVELSKETSNNDHITLNYEKNESWKDAEKIVSSLSTESIQSLYELSKANLTNLNMHLAERRRFAAKFATGVISVIGGGVAIARAFGLLNCEDIILVVFFCCSVVSGMSTLVEISWQTFAIEMAGVRTFDLPPNDTCVSTIRDG